MRVAVPAIVIVMALGACPKRVDPIVIPDSMVIENVLGRPGYFIISAGHLQRLGEQQELLVKALVECRARAPKEVSIP